MTEALVPALTSFLFVFARLSTLLGLIPVFSLTGVPKWVSALLSLSLAALIAPAQPPSEVGGAAAVAVGLLAEVAIGVSAGLAVSTTFSALAMSAEIIAAQTGYAFATLFDPFTRAQESTLGTLGSLLAGSCFVGLGLHDQVLLTAARSFEAVPAGTWLATGQPAPALAEVVSATFGLGVELAGPVVAAVWLVNLFVALLSRLAPRMNAFFAIGPTLTGVVGLVMLVTSLPWMLAVHEAALAGSVRSMLVLVGVR